MTHLIQLFCAFGLCTGAGAQEAPATIRDENPKEKPSSESEEQFPIPEKHKKKEGFTVQIESRSGMEITCLLVNNTDKPVSFFGYAASRPCYHFQFLVDGKWSDEPQSWIDYGRKATLAPRRCSRFVFSRGTTGYKMKVGVALSSKVAGAKSPQSPAVWSEEFEVLKIADKQTAAPDRPAPVSPK